MNRRSWSRRVGLLALAVLTLNACDSGPDPSRAVTEPATAATAPLSDAGRPATRPDTDAGTSDAAPQPDAGASDAAPQPDLAVLEEAADLEVGREFQQRLLAASEIGEDDLDEAMRAATDCMRQAGVDARYPDPDGVGITSLTRPPDPGYALRVYPGVDEQAMYDIVRRCERAWSSRVKARWEAQTSASHSAADEAVAFDAAIACAREQGLVRDDPPSLADAYRGIARGGCRPWEAIE
ncbi:hypothetical protein [Egicoccus sp. AB-alg2]|uniref:hypothetical protein n=1 Tax=Egicoccus sp. AB-alg2 TaxID=3242693 RepID=UPI00359E58DC